MVNNFFADKEIFKQVFERRLIEKYSRGVNDSHISEKYDVLGSMVRDWASVHWKTSKDITKERKQKRVIYFSLEFLIGRLLVNNLQNLGIYEVVQQGLKDLNIDVHELENKESDAGLGNGGLGRLAACFMDSIASLNYPAFGNTIRYEYGFFKQRIVDGKQIEVPDQWLTLGNIWEIRKPKHSVEVKFYGRVESFWDNGRVHFNWVEAEHVRAVPYDVPIVGYRNDITNTLRLWSGEASEEAIP
ncbi:MAG: glycogen/starch/alpha-glucan phosphorylase, partial [Bacillales bacterium]|nr:glycogen/starch/alpha-glucan phosphorylase [Bacillales bacterium]